MGKRSGAGGGPGGTLTLPDPGHTINPVPVRPAPSTPIGIHPHDPSECPWRLSRARPPGLGRELAAVARAQERRRLVRDAPAGRVLGDEELPVEVADAGD